MNRTRGQQTFDHLPGTRPTELRHCYYSELATNDVIFSPPPQPLGKPPRLQRKPSLKNRLKGAFSFQNLRKAISSEKIDEEERLK